MKRWPIMLANAGWDLPRGCNREPQTVESQKWQIRIRDEVLNNPFSSAWRKARGEPPGT